MNKKCESCGSPIVTALQPSGFVEHHREGGLDCVRTQLAQVREDNKRLRGTRLMAIGCLHIIEDRVRTVELAEGASLTKHAKDAIAEIRQQRVVAHKALAAKSAFGEISLRGPKAPSAVEGPKALSAVEGEGEG